MASSREATGSTGVTGPNVSPRMMTISGRTSVTTVGVNQ
jgi:hypothetical protein